MESNVVKEAALKVLYYLDERGWCQNESEDGSGRCCLLGAINCTLSSKENNTLREALYGKIYLITQWNDDPKRTYPEVREMLLSLGGIDGI